MNLVIINFKIKIPINEIQWKFSKSSGSGGQNVNKTNSKVEIIFDVNASKTLTPYQKFKINVHHEAKVVNGRICITVQDNRTQYQNRQLALHRLLSTLYEILQPPAKKRRETIPTRSSQKRRVESKKKRGELKRSRQSIIDT